MVGIAQAVDIAVRVRGSTEIAKAFLKWLELGSCIHPA
jgi:hypothetical protein